ncbi:MAG: hypothetical protein R3270_10810 [Gammaproteobacteria bacterium]|nr:hypothetical protein [Gammaproteobacteria bacterium]
MRSSPRSAAVLFGLLSIFHLSGCSTLESAYGGLTQPDIHRAIMNGDLELFYEVYREQANTPGNNPDGITPLERLLNEKTAKAIPAGTRLTMLANLVQARSQWTSRAFRDLVFHGDPMMVDLALERGLDPNQQAGRGTQKCPLVIWSADRAIISTSNESLKEALLITHMLLEAGADMTEMCEGPLVTSPFLHSGRDLYDRVVVMMTQGSSADRRARAGEVLAVMQQDSQYYPHRAERAMKRLALIMKDHEKTMANRAFIEERRRQNKSSNTDIFERALSRFASGFNQRVQSMNQPVYSRSTSTADSSDYPEDNSEGVKREPNMETDWGEIETLEFNYSCNFDGNGNYGCTCDKPGGCESSGEGHYRASGAASN